MALTLEQFKEARAKGLTPQQIAEFESRSQEGSIDKDNSGIEPVSALDQIFAEPSAAGTRELLRKGDVVGKIAGSLPGGIGSNLASLGLFGEKNQRIVNEAFAKPSKSETFQNEGIRKAQEQIVKNASERTGVMSVQNPVGKAVLLTELAIGGLDDSATGMLKDMYTNPVDTLFSMLDIAPAIKGAKASKPIVEKSAKSLADKYRKLAGRSASKINRSADLVNENKKIAIGLSAITDNSIAKGVEINDTQKLLDSIGDTKNEILNQYQGLRKLAQESDAVVDGRFVAQEIFQSQASDAARRANPRLQKKAFEEAAKIANEGNIPLDVAEETIRRFNAQRPASLSGSIDDVSNAQLNETIAGAYRRGLDRAILESTGKEYQPLKTAYGSLIEIEKDIAKQVQKIGKNSDLNLIRQFSESIDNVPLIYGVLSGNIPLAASAITQKAGKVLIRGSRTVDNQVKSLFKTLYKNKLPPKVIPKEPFVATRKIQSEKDKNNGE